MFLISNPKNFFNDMRLLLFGYYYSLFGDHQTNTQNRGKVIMFEINQFESSPSPNYQSSNASSPDTWSQTSYFSFNEADCQQGIELAQLSCQEFWSSIECHQEWDISTTKVSKDDISTNLNVKCLWIDCKSSFDNQNTLIRHIDRNHVEGRKEDFRCFWLGCPRKGRPFNARYKLLIHMRVHTGHKPNRCQVEGCGKAFSRLENLKIHIRSHTGERPYVCHRCPKAFSNSSDRAKHQRTHIESKPYRCQLCDKKYTDPSSLRKHAKIHFIPAINKSKKSKNKIEEFSSNLQTFIDVEFEDFKCDSLLSDFDWMASEELKDIEQILSF